MTGINDIQRERHLAILFAENLHGMILWNINLSDYLDLMLLFLGSIIGLNFDFSRALIDN